MRHSTHYSPKVLRTCVLLFGLACLMGGTAQGAPNARISRSVVLPSGRSIMLHFQRMKRVEVIEPDLVEVVVASLNDLSLYGKKSGDTTLYVWDNTGLQQIEITVTATSPADKLIEDLRRLLGPRLTYTAYGDKTVVVEGALPAADAERARAIIGASAKGEVQIVDLTHVEGDVTAEATTLGEALHKVLGDNLRYTAWNPSTLLVQGAVGDQASLERARKLLAAVSNRGVNVVDLLEINESAGTAPVEEIARAVGDRYRVWQIQGRTVGVEGTVASQAELDSLSKVLDTFSTQARVVNLVRVVEPKPDINQTMVLLQQMVGSKLTVRPLGEQMLALEGTVANEDELKRLRDILSKNPVPYTVVDLLRVALPEKKQIVCHVRVVDVDKVALQRLGVNWGQLSTNGETVQFVDQPFLIQNMSGIGAPKANGLQNVFPIGSQLDLLVQNKTARILAQPNLVVDDGGKANMLVGGEIPVPIAQPGGGGVVSVTIEWKPYGVQLNMEPTILEGGQKINLKVSPEVSSLDFSNGVTIGGFVVPALKSRKAETVVTMISGGTLVLGGLLQEIDSTVMNKIPLLGDLPIIGQFFRHKEVNRDESELVIMVTPEIMDKSVASFK